MKENHYQIFRDVTERVCGDLDIEKALDNCMHYLKELMPVDYMYVLIQDDNWPAIRPLAMISVRHDLQINPPRFIPMSQTERNWSNRTFSNGKAVITNKAKSSSLFNSVMSHFAQKDDLSIIHMRTAISGKYIGGVGICAEGKNRYLKKHADIIQELHKPFAIALINALHYQETLRLKDQIQYDQRALFNDINAIVGDEVIGAKGGLSFVMNMANQVAPQDSPVLLLGETGTGKEVIARHIHSQSRRSEGPFIKVDCGALQENLAEAELFGHDKGSFTGAIAEHRGRFERAMDGTVFLDEIGELPLSIQLKLLRVLQDREFERIGGSEVIRTNARVIAATHRNLDLMVQNRKFRKDLWYRLNVFPVYIPPLRERKQDIADLAHHIVQRKAKEMNLVEIPTLGNGAIDQLTAYNWPGNVRELNNVIERGITLSNGRPLSFPGLASPSEVDAAATLIYDSGRFPTLNNVMIDHIVHALNLTRGKVGGTDGAARLLDIQPGTLRARMRKLGIPFGRKFRPNLPLNIS
jgi:transcriptional regulator with GAF, ATPase, and Fis domain